MVLYEGDYSGRLQPWRHYVPLRKDHSNFEEVVSVLRNPERIIEITKNAYEEVACAEHNSFRAMVREFDQVILEPVSIAGGPPYRPTQTIRSRNLHRSVASAATGYGLSGGCSILPTCYCFEAFWAGLLRMGETVFTDGSSRSSGNAEWTFHLTNPKRRGPILKVLDDT